MDGLDRAIAGLARCSVRAVPAERREWAEAVWAEAREVPAHRRLSWVAGGLWTVTRQAGIVRRLGYWLGVAALAVGASEMVSLVWRGAAVAPGFRSISVPTISLGTGIYVGPNTAGDFRSLAITTVVVLAALPWVARRRGAFGPASDNLAARGVRVGGCAAICVLELVLARLAQTLGEDLATGGELAGAIVTSLTVILVVSARLWLRGAGSTATPELQAFLALGLGAAVFMFFFSSLLGGSTSELITVYAAGILAVTARGSRIAPATLAFGAGAGVAGGLTWYAASRTGNPWLILVVVVVAFAAPTAAGAGAAWRTSGRDDPEALRRDRLRQGLAAGALTGGVAALLITILIFGTMVVLHRQSPAPSTEADMSVLFFGPLLGMALGLGGSVVAERPSGLRRYGAHRGPGDDMKERAPASEPILTWWGSNRRTPGAPKRNRVVAHTAERFTPWARATCRIGTSLCVAASPMIVLDGLSPVRGGGVDR